MLEYEKYWHFLDLPFKVFPTGDTYFPSTTHEEARARIFQAIRTRKRIIVIAGKPGSGETTLWKRIKGDLEKHNIPFAMGVVENPMGNFSEIMREMGENMGLVPPRDNGELLGALRDNLREKEGCSQRIGAFYVLGALSREETGAYIEYHLKKVNSANLNIFTEDAVHKLYQ